MIKIVSRFSLSIILIVGGYLASSVAGQPSSTDPKPVKAVEELIKVFARFPIVALGELHWSLNQHEFIAALIKHPAFANKVNDIVEELLPFMLRDEHFVDVVEREVINKKRKALLISGTAHMRRCCLAGPLGVTARVEKSHPGAVFVVMPHQGFQERNEELEARLASWPKPGLALVKNTWLGNLSPDLILSAIV